MDVDGMLSYVELTTKDLETMKPTVITFNRCVMQNVFSFPGGRRFNFTEPSGNEFTVCLDH